MIDTEKKTLIILTGPTAVGKTKASIGLAKAIGGAATVLCGKVDAILLTGGIAYSDYIISRLKKRISFLAPIHVYPGEGEMESLAYNALGALKGELPVQIYK